MPPRKLLSVDRAKAAVIDLIAAGATVENAISAVDRSVTTWEAWRREDKEFAAAVDAARAARKMAKARGADESLANISFVEFRRRFLEMETYPHQQQWIDALEGRDPEPIAGTEWDPRNPKRLVINVPPFHSKTQVVTIDWITYLIATNPNIRVALVSKRLEMARKQLYQIKQRLTSTRFARLQASFAPEGGWRPSQGEGSFTQNLIYVAGRTADHKDATVEALGMGSQIYGSRFDVIVLDDCVVLSNASEYEKQITWLESEVENRVMNGLIVVVGTRLASADLYAELRNDSRYLSGRSPWSYLRQPMVLQFADDPKDWKTLWPASTTPPDASAELGPDGLYAMWDGPKAARVRDSKPPAVWSLVYQQQQTAEDATFTPLCVQSSVNGQRKAGPLTAGAWGHPRRGKEGMYTIASMDPAMSGDTFTLVGCVDRTDNKRYLENCFVQSSPSASYFREIIKKVTEEYRVNEWVIEEQGFQGFLVHDPEINAYLASRGIRMTGHYSGKNKTDPDFGVASLAALFGRTRRIHEGAGREVFEKGSNLIELPDPDSSQGVKTLIEELLTWVPGVRGSKLRQDGPMALWFFELRARVILGHERPGTEQKFVAIPFMNRGTAARRVSTPFAWGMRRSG